MEKPISRRQHGFLDYSYVPLAFAMPRIAGFEHEKNAVTATKVIAGNVLLTSLFTRAEWGLFKELPFKTHLLLDVAAGALTAGAPWLLGFAKNKAARNAFLLLGTVSMLAGSFTKPEEMPAS